MIKMNTHDIRELNAGKTAKCGCGKVFKDSGFLWWRTSGEKKLKTHQNAKIKCWYMKDPEGAEAYFNFFR